MLRNAFVIVVLAIAGWFGQTQVQAAPGCDITLRVPGGDSVLLQVDARQGEAGPSVTLHGSGSPDTYQGFVPWIGETEVVARSVLATFVLGALRVETPHQEVDLALPRGSLRVSARSAPEAFPVGVNVQWVDAERLGLRSWFACAGTLASPDDHLNLAHLPPGEFVLVAVPAARSPLASDGTLVGIARATVGDSDVPLDVTILDDSRHLDIEVVDNSGAPCPGATVDVSNASWPLASVKSRDDGRCRPRIVGAGPFVLLARRDTSGTLVSDAVRITDVGPDPVRLVVWKTTLVSFPIAADWPAGAEVRSLRMTRTGQVEPVRAFHLADAAPSPFFFADLRPGTWTVEALDKDGVVLLKFDATIDASNSQEILLHR